MGISAPGSAKSTGGVAAPDAANATLWLDRGRPAVDRPGLGAILAGAIGAVTRRKGKSMIGDERTRGRVSIGLILAGGLMILTGASVGLLALAEPAGAPISLKAASTWAKSPTSQAMPPTDGWRERSVTMQPSSRNRPSAAAPMPLLPPVTTTVLPARPFMRAILPARATGAASPMPPRRRSRRVAGATTSPRVPRHLCRRVAGGARWMVASWHQKVMS